jgi:serine/threonine-protein kinase/endoribonuclease IRE1
MLSRPRNPGHRRASPTSPKLWLAVAILLVPWVSLADAKQPFEAAAHPPQQQGQERLGGHHDHGDQRINNHGSQPVPDGGLVQNLAVTNIRDADLGNETPLMHIKDRQGRPDAEYPSRRQQTPLKQQHAARSSFSNSHNKRSDPARQYKEKPLKNSYNNKISNHNYNNDHILIPDDASALATLAPAQNKQPVRAPHPPRHVRSGSSPASSAGLVPPQVARSLEDWEVEDFVLLATVDGDLYANDRKTLKERWHLEVDQPMVETKHYRTNTSLLDGDFSPIDHYIWAVEPTRDGSVFVWMPNTDAGLIRTGFTMKQLVEELAPFADEEPPVVYTGDKKTTLITLDAATGKVLKWFGSGGSHVNNEESCSRPNSPLYDRDMDECSSTGTITLGRTEYTVSIQRKDGPAIATLKYSEWGPNNFDTDLLHQYQASMDNRYFASHSDGNVYAFDPHLQRKPSTHEKFATPVARVFDVCRPWDAPSDSNPELVVLPQPPMPPRDVEVARSRSRSIFLNQTETGSWYVMSGRSYPLILDAPVAEITHPSWSGHSSLIEAIDPRVVVKALIGTHHVDSPRASDEHEFPSLPASSDDHDKMLPVLVNEDGYDPGVLDKLKSLPQSVVTSIVDLVSNPVLIIMLIVALFMNEHKLRRSYHNFKEKGVLRDSSAWQFWKTPSDNDSVAGTDIADHASDKAQEKESTRVTEEDSSMEPQVDDKLKEPTAVHSGSENVQSREGRKQPGNAAADEAPAGDSQQNGHASPKDDALEHADGGQQDDQPQKKKARRGRRGGVKHRKGSKAPDLAKSESGDKDGPLDDAVTNAKKLADRQDNARSLQPNSLLATNHQELNGPLLKVGDIIVNTAEQLGSGSNGTLVFAGKFDGRDIAVKRMLGSFYFIADQETKLLRETDDHPNGKYNATDRLILRYLTPLLQSFGTTHV